MSDPEHQLDSVLPGLGFRRVPAKGEGVSAAIWKRQTINSNRAVVLVRVPSLPTDLFALVKSVKKEAAVSCGFFPVLYGLGTQLVIHVTGSIDDRPELSPFVDRFDNQWSIVQSLFVLDGNGMLSSSARTWGQFLSSRFQDAIEQELSSSRRETKEAQPGATDNTDDAQRSREDH